MTSENKRKLQALAARYEKHGVSLIDLIELISTAPAGTPFDVAYNYIRFALALEYGETQESFTLDEVSAMTGESTSSLERMIQEQQLDYTRVRIAPFLMN